ncbi:DsbA family protein [Actinoplanes palleronii]|uniref:DsbA family protein n=1 Tax=Actinoplanes palleronii TaxID=113570 RepID=UPI001942C647|nr:DsbA family protein [Actinoplanes palleronii]
MGGQARDRSRELRKAQEAIAAQRGRRRPVLIGGAVIIAGLLLAIVITVVNAAGGSDGSGGALVVPQGATAGGALTVGQADAPVRLEVYLDYMCPYCGRFERADSGEIDKLVAAGTVRLELHPLAFLDRMSDGSRYSTRAANAVVTVADRAPAQLSALSAALFANQPEEGKSGLTDARIAELAQQAGVPQQVVDVFPDRIFEPWIARSTEAAFDSGITGTPTVRINGTAFTGDLYTAGPLTQAINAATGTQ